MSDYIERENAKKVIRDIFHDLPTRCRVNTVINMLPSIDIVRCKECRHWIGETEYYEDREYKACWQLCGQYMNSEFWCKYGERESE